MILSRMPSGLGQWSTIYPERRLWMVLQAVHICQHLDLLGRRRGRGPAQPMIPFDTLHPKHVMQRRNA